MKYVFIRNHNDELMHYGTHGMKWGHRKAQYTSSTASKSATGTNKIKSMLGSNKTQKTYKTAKKENKQKIKETYKRHTRISISRHPPKIRLFITMPLERRPPNIL